jgi:hypothetical protein
MKPQKSRNHVDRFRCPQCGQMVTVRTGFRREENQGEAMVRFECTMEGMCGSPIWDPCPMYVAYMESPPQTAAAAEPEPAPEPDRRKGDDLKDAW